MSVTNLFIHAPSTPHLFRTTPPSTIPLHDLKYRLESIVGIPPSHQILELHSSRTDHEQQSTLPGASPFPSSVRSTLVLAVPKNSDVETRTLQDLGVVDGMAIKVLDTRPKELIQTYTDESLVEKYTMDDETYAARRDTVLAFKQRNKLGRFDPSKDANSTTTSEIDLPANLTVGARCLVDLSGTATNPRKGTLRYIGTTKFAPGTWIGVEYDEPVGKNDGSVSGHRYFTCRDKFGAFVRPDKLQVGDFTLDDFDNLDNLDDDEEM